MCDNYNEKKKSFICRQYLYISSKHKQNILSCKSMILFISYTYCICNKIPKSGAFIRLQFFLAEMYKGDFSNRFDGRCSKQTHGVMLYACKYRHRDLTVTHAHTRSGQS